ncbi:MAG TPA: hut operon positive regulator HutP, partial [Clostridiaceae bacterium]|nr:hut operon positive regulator HutP [Clostridiaceae bacterium]
MEEEIRKFGSKDVVKAAIMIALTSDREEEKRLKEQLVRKGIKTAAVD